MTLPAHPPLDPARISRELRDQLADALAEHGGLGEISSLCAPKPVADDSLKLMIRDAAGNPVAVMLCSSPLQPELVERSMGRARDAGRLLGVGLSRVILNPFLAGHLDGCSYGVFPYREPLSGGRSRWVVQRLKLWPGIRSWLRGVIRTTARGVTEKEWAGDFLAPLEHLAANRLVNDRIRREASGAAGRLSSGQWRPRYVLAHNDLWKDNILLAPGRCRSGFYSPGDFILIDWPGSTLKGHAIYDLIRVARSFGLPRWLLRREVRAHCHLLGCAVEDARSYLLASVGHLGMHLQYFPVNRYLQCVSSCCETLFGLEE